MYSLSQSGCGDAERTSNRSSQAGRQARTHARTHTVAVESGKNPREIPISAFFLQKMMTKTKFCSIYTGNIYMNLRVFKLVDEIEPFSSHPCGSKNSFMLCHSSIITGKIADE